jgi:hypothetical protein
MSPSKTLLRLARRNILLFSLLVFAVSASLLLGLFFYERNLAAAAGGREVGPLLKVLEEMLKGLLAASAVAFLYDWVLKLEAGEQTRQIIRDEIEAVKYGEHAAESGTQLDHLIEFIFAPLDDDTVTDGRGRFCRLSIHCRFLSERPQDELTLMLLSPNDASRGLPEGPPCIFHWELDDSPPGPPSERWLQVSNLRIAGEQWARAGSSVNDGAVVVRFRRPKGSGSRRSRLVVYEFDLRTIELLTAPKNFNFSVQRRMINATFRLDARPLGAKTVRINLSTGKKVDATQSPYVRAPEGEGTCQLFIRDVLEPGTVAIFTIVDGGLHLGR